MKKRCAWVEEEKKISVDLNVAETKPTGDPIITCGQRVISIESVRWERTTAIITLKESIPLESVATIKWDELDLPIYAGGIVRTAFFNQKYDASEVSLGCKYTPTKTSFSIWAPTASKMTLVLQGKQFTMTRKAKGIWHTAVSGNCHLARYYFLVTINGESQIVNDPYAKTMTENSREGVVLDVRKIDPEGFRSVAYPKVERQDAIIYELHVRDATSSERSGVKNRGGYLGLTERDTKTPAGYSTGLSYISELGCTHIQLLPLQDFARVDELQPEQGYNWGYDPLHFFVPEGSYATDATNPITRVRECKQMIQAFHEEGLSVILDVVFNHVFRHQESVFEKLVPGYFFRYHSNGEMSDATGTGNDLATERNMVRKLILDCVDYWLTEYQVDGFRFDLMGVIDVATMQAIRMRCEQEKRPILLLGEGWELDTPIPTEQKSSNSQSDQLAGISFFNDRFRNTMKGNLFDQHALGFVNGNGYYMERLAQLVAGSCQDRFGEATFTDPLQSVNYVECHDNHTLWDRLLVTNPDATELERKQMHQLATGLTLLSQGIPFLHAGQEFFRTKQGDENSYISGDVINQLDWIQREREEHQIQWVQSLIQIRKQHRLFRLGSAAEIAHRLHIIYTPNPVFGFLLAGEEEDLVVFVNPINKKLQIEMPALGMWRKLLSNHISEVFSDHYLLKPITEINGYELAIFKKQRG